MMRLFALVFLLIGVAGLARAADATSDPVDVQLRYPAGSIKSADLANEALMVVQHERDIVTAQYLSGQNACYQKFFAQSCLDDLKNLHREQTARLDAVELEAKRFKRQDEGDQAAADRQHQLDQRTTNAAQDAVSRQQRSGSFTEKQNDAANSQTKESQHSSTDAQRAQAYANKLADAAHQQQSNAEQRARADANKDQTEKTQADKVKDAEDRRVRLVRKHEEKEADRARRAQSLPAGAKPPAPLAPPGTTSSDSVPSVELPKSTDPAGPPQPAPANPH